MPFFSRLGSLLRKIDIFGSSEFLRYRQEPRFGTLTGGSVTLVLVALFAALFWGETLNTFRKVSITANDSAYKLDDPPYTRFNGNASKFIFAVGLVGIDLSADRRYFDVTMTAADYRFAKQMPSVSYQLVPCRLEQWAEVNDIAAKSFRNVGMEKYLCPPADLTLELQGKYNSQIFKFLKISISECSPSTNPIPCAPASQLQKLGRSFILNFYFMNAVVNSGDQIPISYYFEDRNYFPFVLDQTIVSNFYLGDHVIETDGSLYPNEVVTEERVIVVENLQDTRVSTLAGRDYVKICLRKSQDYKVSSRSFTKLDGLFSYIGGLFGFAMTALMLVGVYSEVAYQLQMGSRLFYYQEQQPLREGWFNLPLFLLYLPYELLLKLGFTLPIPLFNRYYTCREEVQRQLDVGLLLNKITYLEKCMGIVFEDHQFRSIYLQHRPTVVEAEDLRRNHGLNEIIHQNYRKVNSEIQNLAQIDRCKSRKEVKIDQKVHSTEENRQFSNESHKYVQEKKIDEKQSQRDKYLNELAAPKEEFLMRRVNSMEIQRSSQKELRSDCHPVDQFALKSQPSPSISDRLQTLFKGTSPSQEQLYDPSETSEQSQGLKFITAAANDLKRIEQQSKSGNKISQRIYQKLNSEITKEHLNVLNEILKVSQLKQATLSKSNRHVFKESSPDQHTHTDRPFSQGLEIVLGLPPETL